MQRENVDSEGSFRKSFLQLLCNVLFKNLFRQLLLENKKFGSSAW